MDKKYLGAFYTPIHAVNYMIDLLSNLGDTSKCLEPSGGDGAFITSIIKRKLLTPKQITVWDLNPDVEGVLKKSKVNYQIKDTLLNTDFQLSSLFDNPNICKFTHIIGNPPYLNKQSEYIKENKFKLRKIYNEIGVNDTYAMFLYLCSSLLSSGGQLCFITSDTYLTLGIHKKLRKYLLSNFTIKNITLCPSSLFKDKGATVNTCIICLINKKPENGDHILFNDCRKSNLGDYNGVITKVKQLELLDLPDYIFNFDINGKELLSKISGYDKLINYIDGGLGMHTTDNKKYLAAVNYYGKIYSKNSTHDNVDIGIVDNGGWKFYHKRGGDIKYYLPAEYAIKWDNESVKKYKAYKELLKFANKQGFVVSGVCSSLSARLATEGALWESNKAMCFFPKDSKKYPPEFFVGLLNSELYNTIVKLFNHTNSLQIRDIKKLPFIDFKDSVIREVSLITRDIINRLRHDINYDFSSSKEKIDEIINNYFYHYER